MEIYFLGTSGSIPTKNRNLISIIIKRKGWIYSFDPGENTQQQMIKLKLSSLKIHSIYLTHLHGDHIMGIPGMLMTANLLLREEDLLIYGPPGTRNFIKKTINSFLFRPSFKININEIKDKSIVFENDELKISCGLAKHQCITFFYVFEEKPRTGKFYREKAEELKIPMGPLWKKLQNGETIVLNEGRRIFPNQVLGPSRPGRKVIIALDTRPTSNVLEASRGADLLIHDGMFDQSLQVKAEETYHSTAREAAELASAARVKRLALVHFSSRYKDLNKLKNDVIDVYPGAIFPDDLTKIEIPYENETGE